MAKDWIQRSNAAFRAQAQRFSEVINADPEAYHVAPSEALLLAEDCAAFNAAYLIAFPGAARTGIDVQVRNRLRKQLAGRMRQLGATIRADRSIPDPAKMVLWLSVPGKSDGPSRSAPHERPELTILSVINNQIRVRLTRVGSNRPRSKPRHVIGAELLYEVGANGSTNPADAAHPWRPGGITFSSKGTITLPQLPPGTKVTIVARWFDGRGRKGPVSMRVDTYVGEMLIVPLMAA